MFKNFMRIKKIMSGILVFTAIAVTTNFARSSERTMARAAFFPLSAETLVPITIGTIWQSNCKKILNKEEAAELYDLMTKYSETQAAAVDFSRIRVGIELGEQFYHADRDLVVYSAKTKESKSGSKILKVALRKLLEDKIFADCKN